MPTTPVVQPANIAVPFGLNGAKNAISVASNSPYASYNDGFPPVTMQSLASGGVPPQGKDFNGIFYALSQHQVWANAGGQYQYDAAFVTATGGYPLGAVLQDNLRQSAYVSLIANNTHDFNSDPSAIGPYWQPYAGNSVVPSAATPNLHITTNTVATLYRNHGVDTSSASPQLQMPPLASLTDGAWIDVFDWSGTWGNRKWTATRNGTPTIMGLAENMDVQIAYRAFRLFFVAATNDWRIK